MSSGDIARKLGITVEATDKASGKLSNVKREVAGIQGAAGMGGSGFNRFVGGVERGASRMKSAIGGAVSHAKARLGDLARFGVGALGITGIFGVFELFKEGLGEARDFGGEVRKLAKLTGMSTETTSALAAAMHHYGIESTTALKLTGFLEKTLGNLATKKGGVDKFETQFGLSLRDSNGHLKDANTLLLDAADYFNKKNIPATQKAAAMAKLFGRSWQDLLPFLSAGSAGIKAAEVEAKRLGLTLTGDNLKALQENKDATRAWDTALGGLKLQIGLGLLPTMTDLASSASSFVSTHGKEIVQFFKDAVAFGRTAGGAILGFGQQVAGAWDAIPAGMRDLLLKGLVADRTMKFLFGVSPVQLALKLGTEALGGIAGAVGKSVAGSILGAGIGKAFVQPVFVTNMGAGGLGGGAAPGGGGKGLKGALGTAASAFVLVEALSWVQDNINMPKAQDQAGRNIQGTEGVIATGDPAKIAAALDGVKASVASLDGLQKIMYDLNANGVKTHTEGLEAALASALAESGRKNMQPTEDLTRKQQAKFDTLRDKIESSRIATVAKQSLTISATDRTRAAVESARIAQVSATRTGDSAIVAAIHGIRMAINLTIPVTVPGGFTRTVTTKTGTRLIRIGGAGAAGAAAGA